jgi:SSS family solute:Na+ symporter
LLTVLSICVAVAVMNVESALTAWWGMQSVLSGGMLGLFLLGAYSRRTTSVQAAIATVLGILVVIFITFGQRLLSVSPLIHVNLSIALGTLTLFLTGWLLATCKKQSK